MSFAPKTPGEMSCRRARILKNQLQRDFPQLTVDVWAIAQGLAYIRVEGPLQRGLVTLVLHSEREVEEFRSIAGSAIAARADPPEFPTYQDSQGREHSEF
jgi:hypothetical protein